MPLGDWKQGRPPRKAARRKHHRTDARPGYRCRTADRRCLRAGRSAHRNGRWRDWRIRTHDRATALNWRRYRCVQVKELSIRQSPMEGSCPKIMDRLYTGGLVAKGDETQCKRENRNRLVRPRRPPISLPAPAAYLSRKHWRPRNPASCRHALPRLSHLHSDREF